MAAADFTGSARFGWIFVLACLIHPWAQAQPMEKVSICLGDGGWPPFHYLIETSGSAPAMTGSTIEILREIFKFLDTPYSLSARPWKRCYQRTLKATGFEVLADGMFNMKRTESFYYSLPIYSTTPSVFFRQGHPLGSVEITPTGLKKFSLCANRGTSLSSYDISSQDLTTITDSALHGLDMVRRGRCDGYLQLQEVVQGHYFLDKDNKLPQKIRGRALPFAEPVSVHLMISKKSHRAARLASEINQALLILQKAGTIESILTRYGISKRNLGFKP